MDDPASSVAGAGGGPWTAGCSQIEKGKKRKPPVRLSYEDLDPRNVRPGDQEPVNSMVWKPLYAFDARSPNLSFS